MNRFNFRSDYVIATVVILALGAPFAGIAYLNAQAVDPFRGNTPSTTDLPGHRTSTHPQPTTLTTPSPTVLSATPVLTATTPALIDCTIWGKTYRVTRADCDTGTSIQQKTDAYLQQQRQQIASYTPLTMNNNLTPPPTGTPLLPTPAPASCDSAAKARLDAQYQSEASSLYRDYQAAVGAIQASGALDSSAPQAAYSAYLTQLNSLKSRYTSDLAAVRCP